MREARAAEGPANTKRPSRPARGGGSPEKEAALLRGSKAARKSRRRVRRWGNFADAAGENYFMSSICRARFTLRVICR